MDLEKEFSKSKALIKQNIETLTGFNRVETDGALLHKSDTSNLSEHNEQYTELLKAYVEDFKYNAINKRKNKQELFMIAKNLLKWIPIITFIFMFVTLMCMAFGKVDVLEALSGLVTALAALLGTFMIVPKMITKYLFNKKEEKHLAEIISKIQDYDREIRGDL